MELVQDILKELSPIAHCSQAADELVRILKEPHFQVGESGGGAVDLTAAQAEPFATHHDVHG